MDLDIRRKKAIFKAWHRGTRECDLLLGNFANTYVGTFDERQLAAFEAILRAEDPDLWDWITRRITPNLFSTNAVYKALLSFHLGISPKPCVDIL